jgi:hypothetical protein
MSRPLRISILTCFLIATIPSPTFCQTGHDLKVRVLDARTGKPLNHVLLWLDWTSGPHLPKQQTNDDGIAIFRLPDPLPRDSPWLTSPFIKNCASDEVAIQRVLIRGLVEENNCGTAMFAGIPKNGELVIFARRLNVWQRLGSLFSSFATLQPNPIVSVPLVKISSRPSATCPVIPHWQSGTQSNTGSHSESCQTKISGTRIQTRSTIRYNSPRRSGSETRLA